MKMKKTAISIVLALVMVFSLVLVGAPAAEAAGHTTHCVCGGKAVGMGDHTCADVSGQWTDLNAYVKSNGVSLATGNYYLSADLDLTSYGALLFDQKDSVVTICLNGMKLFNTNVGARTLQVKGDAAAGTLNICDCKETGQMNSAYNKQGAVIYIAKTFAGNVNLFGGTLNGSEVETAGGTVRVCGGTLNIYGAILQNGKHVLSNNSWAGNLMISDKSTANMYGGAILNGSVKAGGKGANVYISAGCHFNLYGGAISGGTGATDIGGASGANILIKNPSTSFTMQVTGNLVVDDTELDRSVTITGPDGLGAYTVTKSENVPENTEPPVVEPTEEPTQEPTQEPTEELTQKPTQEPTSGNNDDADQGGQDFTVLIIVCVVVALVAVGVIVFVVIHKKKQ